MSGEEVVAKMLEEVDIDGSGTLSFSEFLIFMRTHPYSSRLTDVFPQATIPSTLRKIREAELERLEALISVIPAGVDRRLGHKQLASIRG